tara:strand:- start:243 stop:371 length:129 start_codon:yes stop_codon:yes gene_type:complete
MTDYCDLCDIKKEVSIKEYRLRICEECDDNFPEPDDENLQQM